ncbi:hypothetical protein SAMN05660649_01511 [Desulfotomaculum arcticum]|uniref:LiaF transmembrane domain-containing protein n=1 Tax=Desulfotruncus arcticus DSM 17038 TaxID=1121424 RepID=A0A1I2RDH6_9FIRM|nr:hypothetical protein [Desulfotruncus arcticus]SFG38500.1 hypothetical protein SAMN05660649_01511 [Desulfotomaculum arcticum] [Desulfotruncus arcticus DSM 17038]
MSGKKFFGLILLVLGIVALLGVLGFSMGGLIPFVLGILLVYYGWKKRNQEHRFTGAVLLGLGILFLIGSIPMAVSMLVAAVLLYFGYQMLTGNEDSGSSCKTRSESKRHTEDSGLDDPFDEEWERLMKSAKI